MFKALGGSTPIGLVQAAVGGTYIQSFMPPQALAACNNTATEPPGWIGAPPGPGHPTSYVPWGGQNQPSALWNAMVHPLAPLRFKLARETASPSLPTGLVFSCVQMFRCLGFYGLLSVYFYWGSMGFFGPVVYIYIVLEFCLDTQINTRRLECMFNA
jgi:hypothetical protein